MKFKLEINFDADICLYGETKNEAIRRMLKEAAKRIEKDTRTGILFPFADSDGNVVGYWTFE